VLFFTIASQISFELTDLASGTGCAVFVPQPLVNAAAKTHSRSAARGLIDMRLKP
jgi:hypothetical protein